MPSVLSVFSISLPDVVKLVDTSDLGSDAARYGGSSPSIRTKNQFPQQGQMKEQLLIR